MDSGVSRWAFIRGSASLRCFSAWKSQHCSALILDRSHLQMSCWTQWRHLAIEWNVSCNITWMLYNPIICTSLALQMRFFFFTCAFHSLFNYIWQNRTTVPNLAAKWLQAESQMIPCQNVIIIQRCGDAEMKLLKNNVASMFSAISG